MPQFPQEWLVAQTGKINLAERWVMIPLVPFTPETDEWQEQLEQANAVDQLVRPLMLQMVGPAAGGVIVATAGTGTAFLVDADTFGVSTCALLLLRRYPVERDRSAETSVVEEIREGFRFCVRDARLGATWPSGGTGSATRRVSPEGWPFRETRQRSEASSRAPLAQAWPSGWPERATRSPPSS
jgi:hypothetical protein